MAQTKTGFLRFKAPSGETVERPQEETQSLRQAGFTPEPGQSLLYVGRQGDINRVPVERLTSIPATEPVFIPSAGSAYKARAEERFGGAGGAALATAYGAGQGLTSGTLGAILQRGGLAEGETLGMLGEAQPVAKFVGEGLGMVAQGGALGALGKLGRAAGAAEAAGAAAGAAEAAGAAAKAVPTLGQRVGREALTQGLYGAGSEITEAGIQGREARPLEAAVPAAVLGGAIGAVSPYAEKAFSKAKGFIGDMRAAKIAGDEAGLAAERAKLQAKLDAAKTVAEREAARNEMRALDRAEKASAKEAEQAIKTNVENEVDRAIIDRGDEAQAALDNYKKLKEGEIQARVKQVDDAVKSANAAQQKLVEQGLPGNASKALGKLESEMNRLNDEVMSLGQSIATNTGLQSDVERLATAKGDAIKFVALKEEMLAARKASLEQARAAVEAAKGTAREAQLAGRLAEEQAVYDQLLEYSNAGYSLLDATRNLTESVRADHELGKKFGVQGKSVEKTIGKLEALDSQARRVVPTEMQVPGGDAAGAVDSVVEAAARRMGATPSLGDIAPRVTGQMNNRNIPFLSYDSLAEVLTSAARTGNGSLLNVIEKLTSGLPVGEKTVVGRPSQVFNWLKGNAEAIRSLEPAERASLKKLLSEGAYGSTKSEGRKAVNLAINSAKGPAVPLTIPGEEVAQALGAATGEKFAPEMALSRRDMAKLEDIGLQRAREQATLDYATTQRDEIEAALIESQKRTEGYRNDLVNAQNAKFMAKDAGELRVQQARVDSLGRQLKAAVDSENSLRAAQANLSGLKVAEAGDASLASMWKENVQTTLADAKAALEKSRISGKIAAAEGKQNSLAAQREVLGQQYREIVQSKGLRQMQEDAGSILTQFQKDYGSIGKLERDRITNSYFMPGEAQVTEKFMADYMKTAEGKELAKQILAADKARARVEVRGIEEAVRKKAAEQAGQGTAGAVKATMSAAADAMKTPEVMAAAAFGGPSAAAAVMATMLASRSGKGAMRKLFSALSPMWSYTALERIADIGEKMATSKTGKAFAVESVNKLAQISRNDVERTRSDVDELIKDQAMAEDTFRQVAKATRIDGKDYDPMRQRYMAAVGELQKMLPKTMGKGAPSAEEAEFVRAYRAIISPESLVPAVQSGSISPAQARILQAVSPESYNTIQAVLQTVERVKPRSVNSVLSRSFNVTSDDTGISVGSAMKMTGASMPQGKTTLGTGNPANAANSVFTKGAAGKLSLGER